MIIQEVYRARSTSPRFSVFSSSDSLEVAEMTSWTEVNVATWTEVNLVGLGFKVCG